jgi:hypothetical protein
MKFFGILFILSVVFTSYASAQTTKTVTQKPNVAKSSPAFAEVLLRKTELSAELEELLLNYTEEFPKVKELRYEISVLQKDLDKILTVSDVSKLSSALGRLIVRKAGLQVDVWSLQRQYSDEHPDVKRAKKKVEIYEQAIKEILM